jgi:hypothetical protein
MTLYWFVLFRINLLLELRSNLMREEMVLGDLYTMHKRL